MELNEPTSQNKNNKNPRIHYNFAWETLDRDLQMHQHLGIKLSITVSNKEVIYQCSP